MKTIFSFLWLCSLLIFFNSAQAWDKADIFYYTKMSSQSEVPLVVVLQGCGTDAKSLETMTLWSRLAVEKKFAVLYPNLRQSQNEINCWDWYDPAEQAPGAAMVANVVSCFLNLFAAAGFHSGMVQQIQSSTLKILIN
ncbi:MAG: PHB depolymerase family esterase [Pseudobdellovibrionaceae bacterium]